MERPCNACRHSASCWSNPELFVRSLFQSISGKIKLDISGNDVNRLRDYYDQLALSVRERLLAQFPDGCPLLPKPMHPHVQVKWDWSIKTNTLELRLFYPKWSMGRYSIACKEMPDVPI
jgi:hypothetical protein